IACAGKTREIKHGDRLIPPQASAGQLPNVEGHAPRADRCDVASWSGGTTMRLDQGSTVASRPRPAHLSVCQWILTASLRRRENQAKSDKSSKHFGLSFRQIRNCARQISVIDQLEAAFAAALTSRRVTSVLRIVDKGFGRVRRWKLQKCNKGGIKRRAQTRRQVPGAQRERKDVLAFG